MLIICNGIFKSGSTWLHAIVMEMLKIRSIKLDNVPEIYTNNINSPTAIIESRLQEFLIQEDFTSNNYITKSHYLQINTLSEAYSDEIKFLFINRDPKDAIVSHYYHIRNKYSIKISFSFYYYMLGRYKGYEIVMFNNLYQQYFPKQNFVSYRELKTNFSSVIQQLCIILDLKEFNRKEIAMVKKNTSIDALRKKIRDQDTKYYSTVTKNKWKLIRKGDIGDWKKYFSDSQTRDFKKVESLEVSLFTRGIYFFLFTLRRILINIE